MPRGAHRWTCLPIHGSPLIRVLPAIDEDWRLSSDVETAKQVLTKIQTSMRTHVGDCRAP